jgi:hypothetical protein
VSIEERRARLGVRHRLAPGTKADGVLEIADDLVGLHSSDPNTVFLSALVRMREPSIAAVEATLYEERMLIRMHAMRRTLWVFPLELAAVVQAASSAGVAARERRRLEGVLAASGIDDGPAWFEGIARATLAFLQEHGEAAGAELSRAVPALATRLYYGPSRWGGHQPATSRVLFQLAAEQRIARGRPRGTWTSSQWSWAPAASWLGSPLPRLEPEKARAELARRWLASYGPGTVDDLKWWTGWTLGQTRAALAPVGPVEVDLDGIAGIALPDDLESTTPPKPWAALLPALDPTVMGWKERGWYLGGHRAALFDTVGNAGPTVWWDGRIVGGWAQRRDGEIAMRLLEDVGAEAEAAIEAEAARLPGWYGDVRAIPRFRTPLERELTA